MGEEEKKEEVKEEKKKEVKEEKKEEEENKKDEEEEEIVLKVDMHCEACARKVARALKGFQGVEEVRADYKASKVVVKGKGADPLKVCQRIKKKSGRKVEIISPIPIPTNQQQDNSSSSSKQQETKDPQPIQLNKQEPPPVVTVALKVRMHCEACAQVLQKRIGKVQGVESVTTDIANDQVIVKGALDPEKLVSDVYKRTGKQASIVKDEEKKEGEKKDEEKDSDKQDEKKKDTEECKEGDDNDDDKKMDMKKMDHWPSKYYMEQYSYAPQMFSDENPNACLVM